MDTHSAPEPVDRALRYMSDGFLAVDAAGRVAFVNAVAERLLGSAEKVLGQYLWEVFPPGSDLDRQGRYREVAERGTATDIDIRWPTDGCWYRVRVVPAPSGRLLFITDVTDLRARAAEKAAEEKAAAARTARMRELTAALAEAITVQDVVDAVAERVLTPFGATGLMFLFVEGDHLRAAGTIGYPAELTERVTRLPMTVDYPVPYVIQERTAIFFETTAEYLERFPQLAFVPERSGKKAWAFLPMIASGRPFGICIVSFDTPRRFADEERSLLIAISGLVAQALERARLYDLEHTRARQLQRGLLPRELPTLPAVTAAARYLPAATDMDVGGDWYDVIPLSSERVALVIGDVMGHGVSEAATMGRLRTAVRTLADLELPPDELLTHLNDLVTDLGDDSYATCLYMVYDPTTCTCVFSRAGHPPPAVVHPDGTTHFPSGIPDPPLGAATPPFDTVEMRLPEGSLLVLYTDGLVETATRDIDHGIRQLATALTAAGGSVPEPAQPREAVGRVLESLCDSLAATLLSPQATTDDAAVLVARTYALGGENIATWALDDHPRAAGQAREHIRAQLAQWDLECLIMTTEILASELIGNVIRHARGPIQLRLLRGRSLICEVSDGSPTIPRIRRAAETDEGGRGLQLVSALSQRWGTRYTATGKCIWTEQTLPSGR